MPSRPRPLSLNAEVEATPAVVAAVFTAEEEASVAGVVSMEEGEAEVSTAVAVMRTRRPPGLRVAAIAADTPLLMVVATDLTPVEARMRAVARTATLAAQQDMAAGLALVHPRVLTSAGPRSLTGSGMVSAPQQVARTHRVASQARAPLAVTLAHQETGAVSEVHPQHAAAPPQVLGPAA